MAKDDKTADKASTAGTATAEGVSTDGKGKSKGPAGFDKKLSKEMGDGWLTKEVGVRVVGRLVGRHVLKGQDNDDGTQRVYFQIRLGSVGDYFSSRLVDGKRVSGIKAQFKAMGEDESKEVILDEGALINVDEHKALEEMGPYTRDGGVYDVYFEYVAKDKIPNSKKTFWRVEGPHAKTIKAATKSPGPDPFGGSGSNGDAPIPF